ncbi:MAG: hypothetical protein J6W04_00785 [Bacteroidales bacterium]|nr:hypothetical protein [Bacteroidales bacterium]
MSDLISKQAVLDRFQKICDLCGEYKKYHGVMCRACSLDDGISIVDEMEPAEQPEIIRCSDCKWWNRIGDSPVGYCNAIKHGWYTEHWEINIRRTYKGDFYCADAEPREENDDELQKPD